MSQRQQDIPSHSLRHAVGESELAGEGTFIEADAEEPLAPRVSSPGRDAWRRFRHNWAAMVSAGVFLLIILIAILAPFLHTTSAYTMNLALLHQPPSAHHWFGTDELGRDEYSRLLYGLRVPLAVGTIGAILTVILGMLFGVISGYFGGIVDNIMARFTDVMFAFPGFILAVILVSLYGKAMDSMPIIGPSGLGRLSVLVIVFGLVGWPGLMRFVRSLALSMREQQFVEAARTVGSSHWTIIRRHLLPNMYGLILVQASFVLVGFIYTEAVLSLFGLGAQAPMPDLGQMLINGTSAMGLNDAEWLFPAIFLTILILTLTFIGDGVRDAVDPRSQG